MRQYGQDKGEKAHVALVNEAVVPEVFEHRNLSGCEVFGRVLLRANLVINLHLSNVEGIPTWPSSVVDNIQSTLRTSTTS